jgi:hypothetical protein
VPSGDERLGAGKWAAGPTGVALRQDGPWTWGVLANHLWSFAGSDRRDEISLTFLQPFLAYATRDAWTLTLNSESTYDWREDDLAVPVNAMVSKVVRVGALPVSLQAGLRWWAEDSETGPDGLGFRVAVTFLFPAGARRKP